jgi:hypothetical protein
MKPYEARRTAAASPMSTHPVSMSAPASGSGRAGRTAPNVVAGGWTVTATAVDDAERRSSVNAVPRDTAKATTAAARRIIRKRRRIIKSIPWVSTDAASGRPGAGPVPETRTSYRPKRTRLTPRSRAISSDVPRSGNDGTSRTSRDFGSLATCAPANWNQFVLFRNSNTRIQKASRGWSRTCE